AGRAGRRESAAELRWETVCPRSKLPAVLSAISAAHSYETPAIDAYPLVGAPVGVGLGRVGQLKEPMNLQAILQRVRKACGVAHLQVAGLSKRQARQTIRTLAVGCGSCGRLFEKAIAAGAELYVTGELRHHDALAASAAGLTTACVGHSNSERLTLRVLASRLRKALPTLEVTVASSDRDPFVVV
ncbi:MAG: Nif3-like dinuclear metal center hexameric protein, partial [Planctomycetes bacterium]|nr:Nif3-like dinuclear metal center hexameric protein [Planctomycetota bacterium]